MKALFAEKEQAMHAEARRCEGERDAEVRHAQQAQELAEDAAARAASRTKEAEGLRCEAEEALTMVWAENERLSGLLASRSAEASAAKVCVLREHPCARASATTTKACRL